MGILNEPSIDGADEENGLKARLISQQSMRTVDTDDSDETTVNMKEDFPFLLAAAPALLVMAGVAASFAAMISVQTIYVYMAGGVCILNSPWVAVRQYKIIKGEGIRGMTNQLKDLVELLQGGAEILKVALSELREEAACMNDIQQELGEIVGEQGRTSNEVISMVNDNETILKQIKDSLRSMAIAQVTRIVLSSDRDGDMTINLKELNELTLRIQLELDVRGIDLDGDTFKAMVRKDNDISHVLKVIGAIMFEEETIYGRKLEEYAEEACQEKARQDELVGTIAIAGVISCMRRLASSTMGDEEVDETPMFTVQERFTKGGVDVARGTRVTLSKNSTGGSHSTGRMMRETLNVIESHPAIKRAIGDERKGFSREGKFRISREENVRNLRVSRATRARGPLSRV